MVEVHVAITHAPSGRRPEYLARVIDGLGDLPYTVHTDRDGFRLANYRAAWATETDASHLVVLADDMVPCPGFPALVQSAVRARPTSVLTLFSMRGIIDQARDLGACWVRTSNCATGGAMVMPVAYWRAMGVFERRYVKDDRRHQSDDTRIALWVKHTRLPIYMTAPCLVEHVAPADSLIGHNNRKRVATWLADGSPIDWLGGTIWGGRCSKGDPAWLNDEGRRLFGG